VRPISPTDSFAIAFLNLAIGGGPHKVSLTAYELGLTSDTGYNVTQSFTGQTLGQYKPSDMFTCFVNPSGVFLMTAIIK